MNCNETMCGAVHFAKRARRRADPPGWAGKRPRLTGAVMNRCRESKWCTSLTRVFGQLEPHDNRRAVFAVGPRVLPGRTLPHTPKCRSAYCLRTARCPRCCVARRRLVLAPDDVSHTSADNSLRFLRNDRGGTLRRPSSKRVDRPMRGKGRHGQRRRGPLRKRPSQLLKRTRRFLRPRSRPSGASHRKRASCSTGRSGKGRRPACRWAT